MADMKLNYYIEFCISRYFPYDVGFYHSTKPFLKNKKVEFHIIHRQTLRNLDIVGFGYQDARC